MYTVQDGKHIIFQRIKQQNTGGIITTQNETNVSSFHYHSQSL
jgi:hypothetical protein